MAIDRTIKTLATVLGICLLQAPGCQTPNEVAQASLTDLRNLNEAAKDADETAFAEDIGFNSVEEITDAQIGAPIRIYTVPLNLLQNFQPSHDPNQLLVDTGHVIFPMTVKGQFRSAFIVTESSLTLARGLKGSHLTQTGFPKLIRKIEKLKPSSSSFFVSITPLTLFLLGDRKEGRLVLIAIEDHSYLNLKAGNERDAVGLFGQLQPEAKRVFEAGQNIGLKIPEVGIPEKPGTEKPLPAH